MAKERFRHLNVLPRTYHFHHFLAPISVCIKLQVNLHLSQRTYHQHGHFTLNGTTAIGIPHREHNRRAKLKQF